MSDVNFLLLWFRGIDDGLRWGQRGCRLWFRRSNWLSPQSSRRICLLHKHDYGALGLPYCLVGMLCLVAPDRVHHWPVYITRFAWLPQRWKVVDGKVGGRLDAHVPLAGRFTQSAVQLKATRGHDISGVAFGMEDMVVESWHHGKAAADESHAYFNDAEAYRSQPNTIALRKWIKRTDLQQYIGMSPYVLSRVRLTLMASHNRRTLETQALPANEYVWSRIKVKLDIGLQCARCESCCYAHFPHCRCFQSPNRWHWENENDKITDNARDTVGNIHGTHVETGPGQRWSPNLSDRDANEDFKQSWCGVEDGQDNDENFDSPFQCFGCPKDARKKQENGQFSCEHGNAIQNLDIVIDLPSKGWLALQRVTEDCTLTWLNSEKSVISTFHWCFPAP